MTKVIATLRSSLPALLGLIVLVAVTFVFVSGQVICRQEPAEDLVAVINSASHHPTFYYPGSNRILNIVGYVASWLSDPDANFRFQLFLRAFFATAWPYVLFSLFFNCSLSLLATLLFQSIVLSQFDGQAINIVYGSINPYCTSLFFLSVALLLFQRWISDSRGYVILLIAFVLAVVASAVAQTNTVLILLVFGAYCVIDFWQQLSNRVKPTLRFATLLPTLLAIINARTIRHRLFVIALLATALFLAALHGSIYAKMYPESVRSFSSASYVKFRFNPDSALHVAANLWHITGGFVLLAELAGRP